MSFALGLLCYLLLPGCGTHQIERFGLPPRPAPKPQQARGETERMMEALDTDDLALVTELLQAGFPVNERLVNGQTALHIAVDRRRAAIVKFLLENGADPSLVDDSGQTAYDLAVDKPDIDSLLHPEKLLEALAAICAAIRDEDHEEVQRLLVDEQADPNLIEASSGETPLTLAIRLKYKKVVRALLNLNAKTDVDMRNLAGESPLQLARAAGLKDVEAWLKQRNAKENP